MPRCPVFLHRPTASDDGRLRSAFSSHSPPGTEQVRHCARLAPVQLPDLIARHPGLLLVPVAIDAVGRSFPFLLCVDDRPVLRVANHPSLDQGRTDEELLGVVESMTTLAVAALGMNLREVDAGDLCECTLGDRFRRQRW